MALTSLAAEVDVPLEGVRAAAAEAPTRPGG